MSSSKAIDDPHKVVKVIASDGKTGETREMSYSGCKIVGNGSFGVVFQAKLVGEETGGDIAIKKVLPFEHTLFCLRTLRELKLLKFFSDSCVNENVRYTPPSLIFS